METTSEIIINDELAVDSITADEIREVQDNLVPASELNEEEIETLKLLTHAALDSIPMSALGLVVAEQIFGEEELSKKDENLFLSAVLDETQELQSELAARISSYLEGQVLNPPDNFSIQVFRRKAGYTYKEGFDAKHLGKFCAAVCLKDFQAIRFGKDQEYVIREGMRTPIFETDDTLP